MKMVRVVEVDQWTSTGSISQLRLEDFEADPNIALESVKGGDSEAAKVIFGGHAEVKDVRENECPSIGGVWLINGESGFLKIWKSNYDTSGEAHE